MNKSLLFASFNVLYLLFEINVGSCACLLVWVHRCPQFGLWTKTLVCLSHFLPDFDMLLKFMRFRRLLILMPIHFTFLAGDLIFTQNKRFWELLVSGQWLQFALANFSYFFYKIKLLTLTRLRNLLILESIHCIV